MIKLSDNALLRLRELKQKHNKKYVRLDVKGGGCAGFNYEWSFANEEQRTDAFESAFKFNNPKATSSCGCGTSFSI